MNHRLFITVPKISSVRHKLQYPSNGLTGGCSNDLTNAYDPSVKNTPQTIRSTHVDTSAYNGNAVSFGTEKNGNQLSCIQRYDCFLHNSMIYVQ